MGCPRLLGAEAAEGGPAVKRGAGGGGSDPQERGAEEEGGALKMQRVWGQLCLDRSLIPSSRRFFFTPGTLVGAEESRIKLTDGTQNSLLLLR